MSFGKWKHLNIFPDAFIDINEEVRHHPELMERLAHHPAGEWETKLAEICHYCSVIVDGYYEPDRIETLCKLLLPKLKALRKDNRGVAIVNTGRIIL